MNTREAEGQYGMKMAGWTGPWRSRSLVNPVGTLMRAWIYCLKHYDHEAAEFLRAKLKEVEKTVCRHGQGMCNGCPKRSE